MSLEKVQQTLEALMEKLPNYRISAVPNVWVAVVSYVLLLLLVVLHFIVLLIFALYADKTIVCQHHEMKDF